MGVISCQHFGAFGFSCYNSSGTSLSKLLKSQAAINQLLKIPSVHTVGYRVGRAERGDHVVPVSTVEFEIEFDSSVTFARNYS